MDRKATLQELIDAFAAKEGITKKRAELFIRTLFDVIQDALIKDKFVKVKGFGTFKLVAVGERESVDVNTGERIQIEGHTKISFTPDNSLKDIINRPFSHFQTVVINEGTDLKEMETLDVPSESEGTNSEADTDLPPLTDEPPVNDEPPVLPPTLPDSETPEPIATDVPTPGELAETATPAPAQQNKDIGPTDTPPARTDAAVEKRDAAVEKRDAAVEKTGIAIESRLASSTFPETETDSEEEPSPSADEVHAQTETALQPATEEEPTTTAPSDSATSASRETLAQTEPPSDDSAAGTPSPPPSVNEERHHPDGFVAPAEATPPPPTPPTPTAPANRSTNGWRTAVIVIGIIFLMLLSYFAGYFRLFCPCEYLDTWHRQWSQPVQQQSPPATRPNPQPPQARPIPASADSVVKTTSTDTTATLPPAPATVPTTSPKTPATPTLPAGPPSPAPPPTRPKSRQRYLITGTRDTYTVSKGETLRSIAEYVYGSKGYARYIIQYNGISHPDNIKEGTVLRLPELERNPDYRP